MSVFKKNKNIYLIFIFIFILGVFLMVYDKLIFKTENETNVKKDVKDTIQDNFNNDTENKLANILSNVKGVGLVKVMIEYSEGKETIIAENYIDESSSKNGDTQDKIEKEVALSKDCPIILKEISPKVKGVIIVAQGGDNVEIKKQLISATMSLLDLDANKIEVLTMK